MPFSELTRAKRINIVSTEKEFIQYMKPYLDQNTIYDCIGMDSYYEVFICFEFLLHNHQFIFNHFKEEDPFLKITISKYLELVQSTKRETPISYK